MSNYVQHRQVCNAKTRAATVAKDVVRNIHTKKGVMVDMSTDTIRLHPEDIELLAQAIVRASRTPEQWMNVKQVSDLIDKPESTIYQYTSRNLIPYHKKGKSVRFLASEIQEWMMKGEKS